MTVYDFKHTIHPMNHRSNDSLYIYLLFFKRIMGLCSMLTVNDILQQIASGNLTEEQRKTAQETLSDILFAQLMEKSWFPADERWGQKVADKTARHILTRLMNLQKKGQEAFFNKFTNELLGNLERQIFFIPEVIQLIYSPHSPEYDALVNEGVDHHCRLIRRAVNNVVRKNASGLRHLSLEIEDLQDELWGLVMEEILRCMSDNCSRIWNQNANQAIQFPPEDMNSRKKGIMTHVALSKSGHRLACIRSDTMIQIWDVPTKTLIRSLDASDLLEKHDSTIGSPSVNRLVFSQKGNRLALETATRVYAIPLDSEHADIREYDDANSQAFLHDFGIPYLPEKISVDAAGFSFKNRQGELLSCLQYIESVYDWTHDAKYLRIATASEKYRVLPEWMIDAGFERAVYHIAHKRLIDLIRKYTHTNYACWRCGSLSSKPSDTHCRKCGVDFRENPLGESHEVPVAAENLWQAENGVPSRIPLSSIEVRIEDYIPDPRSTEQGWEKAHDMERILDVLQKYTITYKGRQVACDDLVRWKADGLTNEDIGNKLNIPRGSVDYVWNQCKKVILQTFGDQW